MKADGGRTSVCPFLETVREQQLKLQGDGIIKVFLERSHLPSHLPYRLTIIMQVELSGFEFFNQTFNQNGASPVHLTNSGLSAFGKALAHEYIAKKAVTRNTSGQSDLDIWILAGQSNTVGSNGNVRCPLQAW